MTMREKMARAMYDAGMVYYKTITGQSSADIVAWEHNDDIKRRIFLKYADAALDALMEPTENMIAEGFTAAYAADDGTDEVADAVVDHAFTAMIRAAKDGK